LLLPSDDKTVQAFTFCRFQKVSGCRSSLIFFLPSDSTFQRTLCSGWRSSGSGGVTLRVPAPALSAGRLSPVRSNRIPIKLCCLSPALRAASYRSPDLSKISHAFLFSNFFINYFHQRNTPLINLSY
jgi:hypothetical protein